MASSRSHLVIVNQASNYLTVGFANAFRQRFERVTLMTGSVHVQGEELRSDIDISPIPQWRDAPTLAKAWSYGIGLLVIWLRLLLQFRRAEVLFVSVPPMAYLLSLLLPNRCSVVVWDVYPDAFKIAGMGERRWLFRFWAALNRRVFPRMHRVYTISPAMADLVARYVDRSSLTILPIWSIFQRNERVPPDQNEFIKDHGLAGKFVVQYSGNIGLSHNTELLLELAERLLDEKDIVFQIIGRGPRKARMQGLVEQKGLANVMFLPFQSDERFPLSLSAADLGVVLLDARVSKGSVPSKAYNLMSFGIPSLYVVAEDSELANYASRYGHALVFQPHLLDEMAEAICRLARDPARVKRMAQFSELASRDFRRENADRFVAAYFADAKP